MRTYSFVGVFVLAISAIGANPLAAQIQYAVGQNVVPVYEGWERNSDGTFTMVFGYLNRNYVEEPITPVGPDNKFEPGPADRGQPTHFYPRRQQFVFSVTVPKDWGNKELVWTLNVNGRSEAAYGSLLSVWEIGPLVYRSNRGGGLGDQPGEAPNQAPTIRLAGNSQEVIKLQDPLTLTVEVKDDGLPAPKRRITSVPRIFGGPLPGPNTQAVVGLDPGVALGVTWIHYRGPGSVTFEPMRVPVTDGKAVTKVKFSAPGTYVLRAYADDGILLGSADVTVVVGRDASGQEQVQR